MQPDTLDATPPAPRPSSPFDVGLFPLAGRPYHLGHHVQVLLAARWTRSLRLLVSETSRHRNGEVPVIGSDMLRIWQEQICTILPENVEVEYCESPVGQVYETILEACRRECDQRYLVFSGRTTVAHHFPPLSRARYMEPLLGNGQVVFAAETFTDVAALPHRSLSGTQLRQAVAEQDFDLFAAGLPDGLDKQQIYSTLRRCAP